MNAIARLLLSAVLLCIAAFCVFGFLSTFEPGPNSRMPWQVLYGGAGLAALIGVGVLAKSSSRTK